LNKYREILCGDHVEVAAQGENSSVVVLADGLGSGVKASILSTLTSKIIAVMLSQNMKIEDCVQTITETLPVCSVRKMAYSTFTIIHIINNEEAEIIQYDNPNVILLRGGECAEFSSSIMTLNERKIYRSRIALKENDVLIAVSDGEVHAGVGPVLNFGWERKEIAQYMKTFYYTGFSAKTLTKILIDKCFELYGGKPNDDTTVCAVRIINRQPVNLVIGPPSNRDDCDKMMSLFFSKAGKHIVCGGTTSQIAAGFLKKDIKMNLYYDDSGIPPAAEIDGVDLVTEGVLTINRVLDYARDYLKENDKYPQWSYKKDGASRIARMLFEEATDINFYVGKALNPAHQNPDLPIKFSIKMQLVEELSDCLKKMGKRINVSYF
jgi:hypothetical protein